MQGVSEEIMITVCNGKAAVMGWNRHTLLCETINPNLTGIPCLQMWVLEGRRTAVVALHKAENI